MTSLLWHRDAWDDYVYWQGANPRLHKRINALISDIPRDDSGGARIGKPELLSGNLSGWASRRIDQEHRLFYRVVKDTVEIAACRHHY